MKAILYPYDTESLPVAKYRELLNIDIKYFIYPSGEELSNFENEIFNVVNKEEVKSSISEEILEQVEAICIVDSVCEIDEKKLMEVVSYGAKKGKKIILVSYKYQKYKEKIKEICEIHNVELLSYQNLNAGSDECYEDEMKDIDVPIISVMGMLPMTQKFELQLYLRKKFIENGYRVSQIGSKTAAGLFGFHNTPDYMFTNQYTDIEKIIHFNNFVKRIEKEEKPDLIIVGIPDVIIPFSSKHNYSFGLYAYEILNAVHPDFSFVNLASGQYNKQFYDEISQLCHYKFNLDVDAFYIAKYGLMSNSIWSKDLAFAEVNEIEKGHEAENIFTFTDLCTDKIFGLVEKKLQRYGRFEQY